MSTAKGPTDQTSTEDLLSAASDLVAWGAFEDAQTLIAEIKSRGAFKHEVYRLKKAIERFSELGPEFEQRFLVKAINAAADPATAVPALISAADSLLRWGALDHADVAIARIESSGRRQEAAALKATSRQLRRSGVLSAFSAVGYPETGELNRPYEALAARGGDGADKTIVVFTGAERKFWLSIHVLYHYLRKLNAHVIYLNDHTSALFVNGLQSIGGGYRGLVDKIDELAAGFATERLYVMASSAGGFIGLRAAADLAADGFLGLGIRTDFSLGTRLPLAKYESEVIGRCRDKSLLVDLRAYLGGRDVPRRVTLYCGDGVRVDAAHAENLRGLPNVEILYLAEYRAHNVVPGMIARGLFEGVLQRFVSQSERDAPPT